MPVTSIDHDDREAPSNATRWAVRATIIIVVVLIVGYFATGMPGMDHSGGDGSDMTEMDHEDRSP